MWIVMTSREEDARHRARALPARRATQGAMMRNIIIALALMLTSPAHAGPGPLEPPARYTGPYEGKLTVHVVPHNAVGATCVKLYRERGIDMRLPSYVPGGCNVREPESCIIVIPKVGGGVTAYKQAALRRHELAHCKGWSH